MWCLIADCSVELGLGEAATDFSCVTLVPLLEGFIEFLVCELGKVYDCFAALGAEAAGWVFWETVPVLGAGGWDMEGEFGHVFAGAMVNDAVLKLKQKLYYLMGWGLAIFLMVWMR